MTKRLLAGLQKTPIQESEAKWTAKTIITYQMDLLLPLFNFPKQDYFPNILMTKIGWPSRRRNKINHKTYLYYLSNGLTFTHNRFSPNRNSKLNQCANELFKTKFTSFMMTKIASWPSKDSNSRIRNKINQKPNSYLLNGLLSLFNFPKLDYFANILMTKILFGGL